MGDLAVFQVCINCRSEIFFSHFTVDEHRDVHMTVAAGMVFQYLGVFPLLNVERAMQRRSDVLTERINHVTQMISRTPRATVPVSRRAGQRQHHNVRIIEPL